MRQLFRPVSSWRASEMISLWLGSLFGAAVGIVLGWAFSGPYERAFPSDDPGFDFGAALPFGALGGIFGSVLGVWILLRLIHVPRAGPSALVWFLLFIVVAPLTAGVGSVLLPVNIGIGLHSALLVATIASLVCAVVTYMFVTSPGKRELVDEST